MIAVCLFSVISAQAESTAHQPLRFDLSKIGFVLNGQQICEDKGRMQDYPSETMEQIIAAGPKSIPVLIAMLTDERELKTPEPIICYWYGMAVGDVAFCLLDDLFTDAADAKTAPGVGWNEMLGADHKRPAATQFNEFVKKHGRRALQVKWESVWSKYQAQVYWDEKQRCFKIGANE